MMITTPILLPEDLIESCKELATQYKAELLTSRQEACQTTVGRQSMTSEVYRRAIRYYIEAVKNAGKLL